MHELIIIFIYLPLYQSPYYFQISWSYLFIFLLNSIIFG